MSRIIIGFFIIVCLGCSPGARHLGETPAENPICKVNTVDASTLEDLQTDLSGTLNYNITFWILAPVTDTAAVDAGIIRATDLLNEELRGYFHFDHQDAVYYMESNYDLDYAIDNDDNTRANLIEQIDDGADDIKIIILPTNSSLRGYTTTFVDYHEGYMKHAPLYDYIFLSMTSILENNNRDLIHEFGHYFSLPHTFDIKDYDTFAELGLLDNHTICVNDMNYTCFTNGLTTKQKSRMYNFAATFRHNGIQ